MSHMPPMPKPGSRVACRIDIPPSPDGRMAAVQEGTTGYVVRLVHTKVEGEPFQDGRVDQTIAHVLWTGATDVFPIGPDILRVLPPEAPGPIDAEVVQIVADLKRELSQRHMRYIVDQLSGELDRLSRPT